MVQFLGQEDPWRRERLPTPVFWPGEFHGLYSPWGCKESDTTARLVLSLFLMCSLIFNPLYIIFVLSMLDINCIKSSFLGLILGFFFFFFWCLCFFFFLLLCFLLFNIDILLEFSLYFSSSSLNFWFQCLSLN